MIRSRHEPVRVLVLHSTYSSGPASGENRVVLDDVELLRAAGHEVRTITPAAPDAASLRVGLASVWSRAAVDQLRGAMREFRPDVVHAHNLFPTLSPAVLRVARREGARTVLTLHNYRLLCLPATFIRDGSPCESCVGRLPWRGVVHRCYRGSAAASGALATSLAVHRGLDTFRDVDAYAAVSRFVRDKHVHAGFPAERLHLRHNFAWASARRSGPGRYFLYLGRLSEEKGLDVLLEAWRRVPAPLLVVGDGPLRAGLERQAPANVDFLGTVQPAEAMALLSEARALVLPTICFEGAPRTVVEAFASGVPVLATRTGAVPEFVVDEENGLLVPPREAGPLSDAAQRLLDDALVLQLGDGALASWHERYTPELGLSSLLRVYEGAAR